MKHKKVVVLFSLLVCAMIFVSVINTPEKRALRYFNNHRETLENDVQNCIETGRVGRELNISVDYWDGEHPIIEYVVVSSGIVSASKYYGIFYSFDDEPVSFQNTDEPLMSISEQEWKWNGEGDNYGIVRRLDTNWFYFEAAL